MKLTFLVHCWLGVFLFPFHRLSDHGYARHRHLLKCYYSFVDCLRNVELGSLMSQARHPKKQYLLKLATQSQVGQVGFASLLEVGRQIDLVVVVAGAVKTSEAGLVEK